MIGRSLANGFTGLARFSGRDRPGMFWPYAVLVVVLVWTVGTVAMFVVMAPMFRQANALAARYPDQVRVTQGPSSMNVQMTGDAPLRAFDMAPFVLTVAVVAAVSVILLSAAIVRRLHDSDRSGLWALPTPLLLVAGFAIFATQFSQSAPDGAMFTFGFFINIAYLASLAMLFVFMLLGGTPGPNRYGEQPSAS